MIYYKNNSSNEIRAFNSTEEAKNFINFDDFSLLSADETLKLNTQKQSRFHTEWNGAEWIDSRTEEEIAAYNRSLLPKLSKRQFALYLYDNNMYDQVIQAIEANPRFKIEYDTVSEIERLSPTVAYMTTLLDLTEEQVDEMWEHALTL
ncbi:hypothetical protein IF090_08945 [Acinetobacter towneri]|uniref:hypothetical protein n=1 Tax=Acinetobacter towneri TaxID=202956 RepID=UPI001CE217F8|nr:hypothetical protein [Acinetobacter towneri]MCA4779753.1 hypothetical protein [Acinetobacter towneri]MCA4784914.1 hypothetical protein [Acinetobacter towneri]MCA4788078.1 hypothetical protein [Acinetobacter towneri]MCA4796052.1 hypothetical protein [Acinetobacter towneri]MCA4801263.1 hypothetical protein [Acinetobacter towneri]